jgi:hypothetical protein
LGSLQTRQAAKGLRRVSHRRKTFRVANIRQKSRSEAVKRSRSFETSWQRCRQSLGGDGNVRGNGARSRVGTENAHPAEEKADRSGRLRREPHRSPTPPGETLERGQSVAARSTGCSSLICRIANVGRTYLWPWLLGAERHEPDRGLAGPEPRHALTWCRGAQSGKRVRSALSLRVDNRVRSVDSRTKPLRALSTTVGVLDREQCRS